MSRHGYSEDGWDDPWASIRWSGQVASAIRGKRGQEFLVALVAALDEMPEKRLIVGHLEQGGEVCALGCLGRARGIDMAKLQAKLQPLAAEDEDGEPIDWDHIALGDAFGIARQLAAEVMYMNDEHGQTPEQRWQIVRGWALRRIRPETLVPEPADEKGTGR